jgi:hypothetical protein
VDYNKCGPADEIERLRVDLDKSAKLALSAVHAEREAILKLMSL